MCVLVWGVGESETVGQAEALDCQEPDGECAEGRARAFATRTKKIIYCFYNNSKMFVQIEYRYWVY